MSEMSCAIGKSIPNVCVIIFAPHIRRRQTCNNKRAKWFGCFLFLCSLKGLILKKSPGWKILKKCGKVRKVWKSAETILPFSCCPLVFSDHSKGCVASRLGNRPKLAFSPFFALCRKARTALAEAPENRGRPFSSPLICFKPPSPKAPFVALQQLGAYTGVLLEGLRGAEQNREN